MEQMKRYRLPLVVCALVVLAALAAGVVLTLFTGAGSASGHVSLGQRYLNELNYSEAILEFSNAIATDPSNRQARVGLAQAYVGTGNYGFAAQVLEDVQNDDKPDEEISAALVDIYAQGGNYSQALQETETLIGLTDSEEYYALREQLMQTWYAGAKTRAVGTDQELAVQNGSVVSRGRNTLGQLGTANGLGQQDHTQTEYASAQFPGTAKSVYCAGRTSYVLDDAGNLWAAGENRWGQMGESYATTLPSSGWVQLTTSGDVVSVAGTAGQALVLKADGSLWAAGAGAGQTLTRVTDFGTVLQIGAAGDRLYVLNAQGRLAYQGDSYYGDSGWHTVARGVASFSVCEAGAAWLTQSGSIGCEYGVSFPAEWVGQNDGTVLPDLDLVALAGDGENLVLLGTDGVLYLLNRSGSVQVANSAAAVTSLYYSGDSIMAQLQDGTLLTLQNDRMQPVNG